MVHDSGEGVEEDFLLGEVLAEDELGYFLEDLLACLGVGDVFGLDLAC